jgi:hypothetical protein
VKAKEVNSYKIVRPKFFLTNPISFLSEDQVYSFCIFKTYGTRVCIFAEGTTHLAARDVSSQATKDSPVRKV